MLDCDAANAALLLQKLMAERPADPAVRRLAELLTSIGKSGLPSPSPTTSARPRNSPARRSAYRPTSIPTSAADNPITLSVSRCFFQRNATSILVSDLETTWQARESSS